MFSPKIRIDNNRHTMKWSRIKKNTNNNIKITILAFVTTTMFHTKDIVWYSIISKEEEEEENKVNK